MAFPGNNLLALANKVIARQQLLYRPFVARDNNAAGVMVATYGMGIKILGNIQPVPRSRYEQNGLDFQKNYATIIIEKKITDIARNVTGDQFWYAGKLYQAESKTAWFAQDGWESVLCIEVPGYTPAFPCGGDEDA